MKLLLYCKVSYTNGRSVVATELVGSKISKKLYKKRKKEKIAENIGKI